MIVALNAMIAKATTQKAAFSGEKAIFITTRATITTWF
jgi:hypothetical protein